MGNYNNEIEQFIYEVCFKPMWESVNTYINQHTYSLDLAYSRIKYPDSAFLEDMILEFPSNIRIDEDMLLFDAILSCTIHLTEDSYRGFSSCDINQWLRVSCKAVITDKLESLTITKVQNYVPGQARAKDGTAVSKNIVPIIKKQDLDAEATAFLNKYCPEALEEPMQIPILDIAEKMQLEVIQGHRITDDFSIFGQICFSSGKAQVYDLFKCGKSEIDVKRGTILIDAYTFWERNLGCVNNTIAHELFHWHKHRMFAAIKHILRNEKFIACRCPSNMQYPQKNAEWTDEQRMEWQANNIAPRILMPVETFCKKADELYSRYDYANTPLKIAVLTCIAGELASFYGVSRQSAIIRMIETGYKEAASIYQYDSSDNRSYISKSEAFVEYSTNLRFRALIDSGRFKHVDGYFVINDDLYIDVDDEGRCSLTEYAWSHLDECTLKFRLKKKDTRNIPWPSDEIFHRANDDPNQKIPEYDASQNKNVLKLSEETQKKRADFEKQNRRYQMSSTGKTCWQLIFELIQDRGWNKITFSEKTLLGEEVYSKAKNNNASKPDIRTIIAIACGLELDLPLTTELLRLAGHALDDSLEHRALSYCVTSFPGESMESRNDFLVSYGFKPLGSKQRS